MKEKLKKLSEICNMIFGYGIMIVLLAGGLTFFGYLVALIIGGPIAEAICIFIYKKFVPVMVFSSTSLILFGMLSMYLAGETALTTAKRKL